MLIPILLVALTILSYSYYSRNKKRSFNASKAVADTSLQNEFRRFAEEIRHTSHYFQILEEQEQELFVRRAWVFYKMKRFEARRIEQVSFRMRTIISSYAAQITFGLQYIHLENFRTIIVYPQPYVSTVTNQAHKGETNPNGAIIFSWKDLTTGHNEPKDGVNLALHELAHALRLENITMDREFDFLDREALDHFNRLAESEISRMSSFTNYHFLRAYGATNLQEFFAVCVENFFERPIAFSEALPQLYETMTRILQQDPLKRPIRIKT